MLKVKREKGTVQVPVYMRDYTEPAEYSYVINYRGFTAYLIKRGTNSWWAAKDGKWLVMGESTKKLTETNVIQFVDKHYDVLDERGYIEKEALD